MRLQFVGCGDAFGSGGRFNTCFHLAGARTSALIDCGASALIALKRLAIRPNAVRTILVTHFHGDHFGGLPFFLLDAQLVSKRTAPLTIAGPPGLARRLALAMEAAFPGSSETRHRFELVLEEMESGVPADVDGMRVTPFAGRHGEPGGPSFALRVEAEGRVVAYTGDTEWTDSLVDAGRQADLLVAEAYFRDRRIPLHLDLATLEAHLPAIAAKRIVLTHMSDDMLAQRGDAGFECAEDGLVVQL